MFGHFDWHHFISAFVVLFAVIDITGNIPVILTLKKRGKKINALKAAQRRRRKPRRKPNGRRSLLSGIGKAA